MELIDIKNKRHEVERKINLLIKKFEEETSTEVNIIEVDRSKYDLPVDNRDAGAILDYFRSNEYIPKTTLFSVWLKLDV